jgi:hypothetical protein
VSERASLCEFRPRGRLQHNPDPIKVVTGARRGEALGRRGWRCEHEDGRGRCTSTETNTTWDEAEKRAVALCAKHRRSE